jgi:aspartate carbamoyltransferase regulatory subunit
MTIDGISNGLVLDHIEAGKGMEVYRYLHLDEMDCCIAVIQNVRSSKYGKKDIIKVDAALSLDFDVLGYLDPNITVDIIKDGKLIEKKHLKLPRELRNVLRCKNPRCITSTEREVEQLFCLTSPEEGIYRCAYCENEAK